MTDQPSHSTDDAPATPTGPQTWETPDFTVIPVSKSEVQPTSGTDGTAHSS